MTKWQAGSHNPGRKEIAMVTTTKTLLAIARLLNVTVDDIVRDDALMERVVQFLNDIQH